MKIKKNITINLSPDNIKQIIYDYLTNDGYCLALDNISFDTKEECSGFGVAESYRTVFSGCSVNCEEK